MSKIKKKTKVNLWDYYWQMCLAIQRLVLIKKALGIAVSDYNEEMDCVLENFSEMKADKNGEFEMSCGYLTIRGWRDPNTQEQKIDFYFDLASN